jgi:hypothetical protein
LCLCSVCFGSILNQVRYRWNLHWDTENLARNCAKQFGSCLLQFCSCIQYNRIRTCTLENYI